LSAKGHGHFYLGSALDDLLHMAHHLMQISLLCRQKRQPRLEVERQDEKHLICNY
jgi:hypothetical protein